ncbi:MAG: PhoX family phosphatase [Mobilicoccus sp.]|nr:PhoX family phosphatase [Mobilicoccus sp.]
MYYPDVDPDDVSSNPSKNRHFSEVLEANVSRRNVLGGTIGVAAVGFFAGAPMAQAAAPTTTASVAGRGRGRGRGRRPLLGFKGISVSTEDTVRVPEGYTAEVLIPWGTPIHSGGPAWQKNASNSSREQAVQIGFNHDGMHYYPFDTRGRMRSRGGKHDNNGHGLLVVNHEYTDNSQLTTDGLEGEMTLEKARKHQAAHGVSVVAVRQGRSGKWTNVDSPFNRRVHANTPMTVSGPAAKDERLKAKGPVKGTLNNCSMGFTPWGTYVTCEENFHTYFGSKAGYTETVEDKRYGITGGESRYRWHEVDSRFDLNDDPNEKFRFGWCVEIDPFDPDSTPVKRTALGRIKHENAWHSESRGRIVVYTGDDQNGEYIYKFVSDKPWRAVRAQGKSPLDEGVLYVAKFHEDGTGTWLPLVFGQGPLTAANGWKDQGDVLVRTRTAADALGATPMDRPEWITENTNTGHLFATLTNGSSGPNPANPRDPNPYGHIIRWMERYDDKTGTEFDWDIFVLAGDPTKDPKVNVNGDPFGSPDGIWADPDGRIWIQTDVSNSAQLIGEYENLGNNMMLCADPNTREIRRFLTGPKGCEITGCITTPDQRTMFINIQHPGEATRAIAEPTPENPQAVSSWPDHDPKGRPRPATVVIRKNDGGVIGT